MYNVPLRHVHENTAAMEKQCVTYSECVFLALSI